MTPAVTGTPSRTRVASRVAGSSTRHLRLVPPPDTEPPEEPQTLALSTSTRRKKATEASVQGTLALLFTLPGGVPSEPAPRAALRLAPRPSGLLELDEDD